MSRFDLFAARQMGATYLFLEGHVPFSKVLKGRFQVGEFSQPGLFSRGTVQIPWVGVSPSWQC